MKKIFALIISAIMCLSFVACTTETGNDNSTDSQNTINQQQTDSTAQNTDDSNSSSGMQETENSTTDSPSVPQSEPYKQNVLYRADFDVPDMHGTGYGNLIDYYNAYPDGKDGGTFANAGLMVHYRTDMDHDLSLSDSLAFRTYRGIGLGSSKAEVFAAYGESTIEPPFPEVMGIGDARHTVSSFVDYRARIASGACVGIRFYFDQNDTVMYIDYGAVYLKYAGNVSDSTLFPLAD